MNLPEVKHLIDDYCTQGKTRLEVIEIVSALPINGESSDAFEYVDLKYQVSGDDIASLNLTDYGNAERLVRLFGGKVRYSPERKMWLIWSGRVWEWDTGDVKILTLAKQVARSIYNEAAGEPDDKFRKVIIKHAQTAEGQSRLTAMVKSAESERGVAIKISDLDSNYWLLNVQNGTIDLKTGLLQPHNPDNLITELLPLDFDLAAVSEEWDRFLNTTFENDGDLIQYVQRAIGYSITGDQSEQVFFFCFGSGANGKSTLLNACRLVMGNYASQIPSTSFMIDKNKGGGPNEAIASLYGKRFVCSTELEDGQVLSVSLVKSMTGGEPIWCEHKFERGFNFQPTHKLWLSGNHEPTIKDTTDSIWRRVKKIPFNAQIPEESRIKGYAEILAKNDASAILAWLVSGCVEWQKLGGLSEPNAVLQAVNNYRDKQDLLHDFLSECCVFQKSGVVDQKDLYAAYKQWSEENDNIAMGKLKFRARILEKNCQSDAGNKNIKIWRGIRLKTDQDNQVTPVTSVTDFAQSFFTRGNFTATLPESGNRSNTNNTSEASTLPDCPKCGVWDWVCSPKGDWICQQCGGTLGV